MPIEHLTRYFEARDVDLGLAFGDLTETQVEPIFEAFTALPVEQQADNAPTAVSWKCISYPVDTISPPAPS